MDRRKNFRMRVNMPASGRAPASQMAILVTDISLTGCRIEGPAMIKKGATILLKLASGLETSGQVVWSEKGACGVEFHRQMNLDVFASQVTGAEVSPSATVFRDQFGRPLPPISGTITIDS